MLKKRRKKALEEGHTNNIWNRHDFVMCGLGEKSRTLAIVKHIVTQHGAELNLESEPGKGTTITILFENAEKSVTM